MQTCESETSGHYHYYMIFKWGNGILFAPLNPVLTIDTSIKSVYCIIISFFMSTMNVYVFKGVQLYLICCFFLLHTLIHHITSHLYAYGYIG